MTPTPEPTREAIAAMKRIAGWQHLVKYAGMSPEWMDATLGALARAAIAQVRAEALREAEDAYTDFEGAEAKHATVVRRWLRARAAEAVDRG